MKKYKTMPKGFTVLLVEDNKHDVKFVERAWRINKLSNPLKVVPHGQACMDYLRNEGKYTDKEENPKPGIVLMDINMPVMNGIEALKEIKEDPKLKATPVIMLTTSKEDTDRVLSYELGANTFIQKPVDFDNFSEAIRSIETYWTISELP